MSLFELPNEILVKIFAKTRQADLCNIKLVNKRFGNIVDKHKIRLPTATTLKILGSPPIGGKTPSIEIYAVFPLKKVEAFKSGYEQRHQSVKTKGIETDKNVFAKMADALLELRIGSFEELMFDYLTAEFDYKFIFAKAGIYTRRITAVRNSHLNDNEKKATITFVDDLWLKYILRQNVKRFNFKDAKTNISFDGMFNFMKEHDHRNETVWETFHFRKLEITATQRDEINKLSNNSDDWIQQEDNEFFFKEGRFRWITGEKTKKVTSDVWAQIRPLYEQWRRNQNLQQDPNNN